MCFSDLIRRFAVPLPHWGKAYFSLKKKKFKKKSNKKSRFFKAGFSLLYYSEFRFFENEVIGTILRYERIRSVTLLRFKKFFIITSYLDLWFDGFWQVVYLSPIRPVLFSGSGVSSRCLFFSSFVLPPLQNYENFFEQMLFVRFHILKRRTPFLFNNVFIITSVSGSIGLMAFGRSRIFHLRTCFI